MIRKRKTRLELLEEEFKFKLDSYLEKIQLKTYHAMFEDYKKKGFIESIESAMFATIVITLMGIMYDNIKSIADTLEERLEEIEDNEETELIADFIDKKGLEIKRAIDDIVRLRNEQGKSFEDELLKLVEEGKI